MCEATSAICCPTELLLMDDATLLYVSVTDLVMPAVVDVLDDASWLFKWSDGSSWRTSGA